MAQLAGRWGEPTVTGSQTVTTNGIEHHVPDSAEVRLVHAGKIDVAHIRHDGRVYVLSRLGQLLENDDAARSRAQPKLWSMIAGK